VDASTKAVMPVCPVGWQVNTMEEKCEKEKGCRPGKKLVVRSADRDGQPVTVKKCVWKSKDD
jgi:hypothetical protein